MVVLWLLFGLFLNTLTVKPVVRLRATLQYCHAMLVFWLAVCSEQVASSNFNLLIKAGCFRYCCNTLKTGTPVLCTKPNYRFDGITRASEESGSCSQRYPRRPNQDLVQGCTVRDFVNIDSHEQRRLQETFWNAFPCGSDSYRQVLLKVRESDSPFLLKRSRSSQPLPQETEHTKPSVAKSKLEPKNFSHHPMIVMIAGLVRVEHWVIGWVPFILLQLLFSSHLFSVVFL